MKKELEDILRAVEAAQRQVDLAKQRRAADGIYSETLDDAELGLAWVKGKLQQLIAKHRDTS